MEPNQQNPMGSSPVQPASPVTNQAPNMGTGEHKKVGPIIATLVIVLILVIAGLYLFASKINKETLSDENSSLNMQTAEQNAEIAPVVPTVTNTSDDPSDLQADLEASVDGLDSQNF